MKELIKRILRRILGWYIEPLYQEKSQMRLEIQGLLEREDWTRRRFEGIEGREDWTRKRFEGQDARFTDQELRLRQVDQRIDQLQQTLAAVQLQDRSVDAEQIRFLTFAQSGEDAIVAYILRFLQKPFSEITYLDLGANHAKELSNTYYFYLLGARGVLVEANPELIRELEKERPGDIVLNVVVRQEAGERADFYVLNGDGLSTTSLTDAQDVCRKNPDLFIKNKYEIETCTVNQILKNHFKSAPTILSIDLEGIEESILRSIDFDVCNPWIIILENIPYTPLLPIDQREFRCVDFLQSKGYTEYAFTGINSIFVLKKAVQEFNERRMRELQGGAEDGA